MHQETSTRQNLQLRVDPRVVLSGQLLELNCIELRSAIETEMMENPALEWLDEGLDQITHEDILGRVAPGELRPGSSDWEVHRSKPQDAEECDWTDFASSFDSLEDHLEAQLHFKLNPEQLPIAFILIGSLDDRGYLTTPLEEIALDHNLDFDELTFVLAQLQACEPAGIAATCLQECLKLQLRDAETHEQLLAKEIVERAFDELAQRNVRALMRKFRAIPELVQAAFDEIMQLNPFPADSFARDHRHAKSHHSNGVPVDLHIERSEQGWSVRVPGIDSQDLIISRSYRTRIQQLELSGKETEERRHLAQYVQKAKVFIEALRQRGATMRRIGYYLIETQSGFISTGDPAFLKSLTRRKLAQDLGLHESTISRATAGKHVQLANGEVISFDVFFKPALRIQQMIAEILSSEKSGHALSDEKIAQLLAERGVHVARRTVNKYRDRSKMLSSRRRNTA